MGDAAHRVFVFGTLKRGHPLHEQGLADARFLGAYRTRERYPMVIAGPWFAPMMFDEPGEGLQVTGELYAVDEDRLARLDRMESVGQPGNWRVAIAVEPAGGGDACVALAYVKARALATPAHSGYLAVYDDRRFVPFDRR